MNTNQINWSNNLKIFKMIEKKASLGTAVTTAILVPNTHGGFFTAVALRNYLQSIGISEVLMIEALPCQIKQVKIPNHITDIYVGGMGVKNCPNSGITDFLTKHDGKIKLWVDNHPEGKPIEGLKGKEIYMHAPDKKFPSCTAILGRKLGDVIKPEWVETANHFENAFKNPSTPIAEHFKYITASANGKLETAKEMFAKHLINGTPSAAEIKNYLQN